MSDYLNVGRCLYDNDKECRCQKFFLRTNTQNCLLCNHHLGWHEQPTNANNMSKTKENPQNKQTNFSELSWPEESFERYETIKSTNTPMEVSLF